jgi:hypothetical protein
MPFTVTSRHRAESDQAIKRPIKGTMAMREDLGMIPTLVGIFVVTAALLWHAGLDFAVVAGGTALSGTILMMALS